MVTFVPGLSALPALHALEMPQKDNLCGCFWGALVLRAARIDDIDQDRVTVVTGTTPPDGDPATFVSSCATGTTDLARDPASQPARPGQHRRSR